METLAAPVLKNIEDVIASRLEARAATERKRLEAEAERTRLDEAGKEPFRRAVIKRIARDYNIDVGQNKIDIELSDGFPHDNPEYNFRLFVENPSGPEGVEVTAWIAARWPHSADILLSANPRDMVWIARRRGLFDGSDSEPVTIKYDASDLVEALVWAKTGE